MYKLIEKNEIEFEKAILVGTFFLTAISATVFFCISLFALVSMPSIITESDSGILIIANLLLLLFIAVYGWFLLTVREKLTYKKSVLAVITLIIFSGFLIVTDYVLETFGTFTMIYLFLSSIACYFLFKNQLNELSK